MSIGLPLFFQRFIEKVIDGIIDIYAPIQTLSLIHVGGDEVSAVTWSTSDACVQQYGPGNVK